MQGEAAQLGQTGHRGLGRELQLLGMKRGEFELHVCLTLSCHFVVSIDRMYNELEVRGSTSTTHPLRETQRPRGPIDWASVSVRLLGNRCQHAPKRCKQHEAKTNANRLSLSCETLLFDKGW